MTGNLLASELNQLVWEFLLSGGVFMGLIVLCSLVAATIVIHRWLSLRREAVMPRELLKKLRDVQQPIGKAELEELRSEAIVTESALGEIACAALSGECDSASEAMDTTEAVAREEVLRLQSGLSILEDVITIAPLLGLLGTVSGLVAVFAELGNPGSVSADPKVLAEGIARALNTTIAGLAVTVPTVVARTYFQKKIEAMAVRMEILFGRLIHARYRNDSDSKVVEETQLVAAVPTAPTAPVEENYPQRPLVRETPLPEEIPLSPAPASPAALDELPATPPSPPQVERPGIPGQVGPAARQAEPGAQIPDAPPQGAVGGRRIAPQPIQSDGGNPPKPSPEKPAE